MLILYFKGHRSQLANNDVFISLKIIFTFTNAAGPDETPHHLVFSYVSAFFA